jgi:hypothetical protein
LLFLQTRGDADLFLYDEDQNLIASTQREGWYVDDIRVEATGRHQLTLQGGDILLTCGLAIKVCWAPAASDRNRLRRSALRRSGEEAAKQLP